MAFELIQVFVYIVICSLAIEIASIVWMNQGGEICRLFQSGHQKKFKNNSVQKTNSYSCPFPLAVNSWSVRTSMSFLIVQHIVFDRCDGRQVREMSYWRFYHFCVCIAQIENHLFQWFILQMVHSWLISKVTKLIDHYSLTKLWQF